MTEIQDTLMVTHQEFVAEFHRAMGAPAPDQPTPLTLDRAAFRVRLIDEEAAEFRAAVARGDQLEMIDALVDLLYVTYGAAVEMGVDLAPFFDEVHRANLQKVPAPDGGKVAKPEGWTAPDIRSIYQQQYGDPPRGDEDGQGASGA